MGTTCEHLGLCMALKVPTFVVVSKVDLCSNDQLQVVEHQLKAILCNPGCNKIPLVVRNEADVYSSAQSFGSTRYI